MDAEEVYKHYRSSDPEEVEVEDSFEPEIPARPHDGDRAVCKHCKKAIRFLETRMAGIWTHLPSDDDPVGVMPCAGQSSTFPSFYAEPIIKERESEDR